MKVGDLVRVSETHWHRPGEIGIIVRSLFGTGKAFKVLYSNGNLKSTLSKNLEVINEN